MGQRWYQRASGRFTQLDPLGDSYVYAGSNPANYTDPTGLHWDTRILSVALGAVVGAILAPLLCSSIVGCMATGALSFASEEIAHGILDGEPTEVIVQRALAAMALGAIAGVVGRWMYNIIEEIRRIL